MKSLIVEDDFTCRLLLQKILDKYGEVHVAVNGKEAIAAVKGAIESGNHYQLICLDIMMPEMDGQECLQKIREMETESGMAYPNGAKVIMTTALGDPKNILSAYGSLCDAYIQKPIYPAKFTLELKSLNLI